MFHRRTIWSAPPAASILPLGLKLTIHTEFVSAVRVAYLIGWTGSAISHSHTLPSPFPVASICPVGLKASQYIVLLGPASEVPRRTAFEALLTSQSKIVPSALPPASNRPSGLKATEYTSRLWPRRGRPELAPEEPDAARFQIHT